jgi:hypothetical protein
MKKETLSKAIAGVVSGVIIVGIGKRVLDIARKRIEEKEAEESL